MTTTQRRLLCVLLLTAPLMTGCGGAMESYVGARTVTVQGQHAHKSCQQLHNEHKSLSEQIAKTQGLMSKAGQEAAGSVIGSAVYGPTLVQAQGNRRIVQEALDAKECGAAPPPATAAAPAAQGRR